MRKALVQGGAISIYYSIGGACVVQSTPREYNHATCFGDPTQEKVVTQTHRVLAVEDDADTLQLMRMALRDLPLQIVHAGTGAEAITFLEREVPELIFLDINLPDMHGWEVLDRFKSDARLKQTRVIVLTSHNDPVHRLIGTLQPITAYLTKPVIADQLRQQVRSLLTLP